MSGGLWQWLFGGVSVAAVATGVLINWASDPLKEYLFAQPPCDAVPLERRADSLRTRAMETRADQERGRLLEEAVSYYRQAYDTCRSAEAAFQLGMAHCTGLGAVKDRKTALQYFDTAEMSGVNSGRIARAMNICDDQG